MSVLIGTDAGVRLVIDTVSDNNAGRLAALSRHLGLPTAWTTSAGVVSALRDGGEAFEFDVTVTGPHTGTVRLLAPGGRVVAATKRIQVDVGQSAVVRFRVSRNHRRGQVLAAPPPVVTTAKQVSAYLPTVSVLSVTVGVIRQASSELSSSATLSATATVTPPP